MVYAPDMLAALLLLLGPEAGPLLNPPRLPAGTERVYAGTAEEVGRAVGNPFRKRAAVEYRLLVLETHPGGADCAVMTRVWPLADPVVAGPAAALTGRGVPERGDPAVRLDLVRVDPRGRAWLLPAEPFAVGPTASATPMPPLPLDALPAVEAGMFLPLPPRPVAAGDAWETPDADRPPVRWAAGRDVGWNGAAAVEVTAAQQSAGYDTPAAAVTGWRRADTLLVLPLDGFAAAVDRRVERREGGTVVGEVRLSYAQAEAHRLVGGLLREARRDVEFAGRQAAELAPLLADPARADTAAVRQRLVLLDRHLDAGRATAPFRQAVESLRRRCEAAVGRGP